MVGLFPKVGVSSDSAINANEPEVTGGCEAVFYPNKCRVAFDAAQANAVMSELLGGINVMKSYECDRTDNLHRTFELLRNMCVQPTRPFTGLAGNFFAGCFDGHSGKVPAAAFLDGLIGDGGGDFSICGLPTKDTLLSTDAIAGCVSASDKKIPMDVLETFLNSGRPDGPSGFLIGQYMGTLQDFRANPNASFSVIPLTGLNCFFLHDKRSPTGGQNPQNPGQLMVFGQEITPGLRNMTQGDTQTLDEWRYGTIFPFFIAQNHLNPNPQPWWYVVNKSGFAVRLSNGGTLANTTANPPSADVDVYAGSILF